MKDIYTEYALLDAQITELSDKKEAMRSEIMQKIITENDGKTVESAFGKFSVAKVKSWTYPTEVVELQDRVSMKIGELKDELKSAEAIAQSTGEATCTESEMLKFTKVKL